MGQLVVLMIFLAGNHFKRQEDIYIVLITSLCSSEMGCFQEIDPAEQDGVFLVYCFFLMKS